MRGEKTEVVNWGRHHDAEKYAGAVERLFLPVLPDGFNGGDDGHSNVRNAEYGSLTGHRERQWRVNDGMVSVRDGNRFIQQHNVHTGHERDDHGRRKRCAQRIKSVGNVLLPDSGAERQRDNVRERV